MTLEQLCDVHDLLVEYLTISGRGLNEPDDVTHFIGWAALAAAEKKETCNAEPDPGPSPAA